MGANLATGFGTAGAFSLEEAAARGVQNKIRRSNAVGKDAIQLTNAAGAVLEDIADSYLKRADQIMPKKQQKDKYASSEQIFSEDFKNEVKSGTSNWPVPELRFVGQCLVCGKDFKKGDFVLREMSGDSAAICIDCCTEENTCDCYKEILIKIK